MVLQSPAEIGHASAVTSKFLRWIQIGDEQDAPREEVRHGWVDLVQSTEALGDPQPLEELVVSRRLCDPLCGVVALADWHAAGMDGSGDVDPSIDDGVVGITHLDLGSS